MKVYRYPGVRPFEAAFLADLPPSLWTHFKQLDSAEKGSYLLVFDQFEEFFSYPPEKTSSTWTTTPHFPK